MPEREREGRSRFLAERWDILEEIIQIKFPE
jgi:hypothetical protein